MATIPSESINAEDLGRLAEEVRGPMETISRFMRAVRVVLNGNIRLEDNVACVTKEVPIRGGFTSPVIISLGKDFSGPPKFVLVGGVKGDDLDVATIGYPWWEPWQVQGDSGAEWAIRIRAVAGLTAGASYKINLIIMAG